MHKINWNRIFSICRKELIFALRDIDVLLAIIILPILSYPLIAFGSATFISQARQRVDVAQVEVVVPDSLRQFASSLATATVKIRFEKEPLQFIKDLETSKIDALVEIATQAADFHVASSVETLGLKVHYDPTRWKSKKAEDFLYDSLKGINDDLMDSRLANKHLSSSFLNPVKISRISVAKPAKVGGFMLGQLLPGLIIMYALMGAFLTSIDLTAGERDRGTLETLMLSPAPLKEIMSGKLLAIIGIILFSVIVNLSCLGLMAKAFTLQIGKLAAETFALEASFSTFSLIFLSMLPFSATLGCIFMSLAFISGSMKKAQTYLTPVLGIMLLPAFAGVVPGLDLTPLTAMIPVVNQALLLKVLFVGDCTPTLFAITFIASLAHCSLAVLFAASVFRQEDVLVRDSSELSHFFHPVPPTQTTPTARAALLIFGSVFLLISLLGNYLQNSSNWSVVTGLALMQLIIVLGPPLAYLLFYRYRLIATLNLHWQQIRPVNFILLPFMNICVLIFLVQYTIWQEALFPAPIELNNMFLGLFDSAPIWWVLTVACLFAGFCEEVLFRGVIQKGLGSRVGPRTALLITAMMFGFFHLTPYKMVTTALLGLWLGYIYQRTGSLWTSIYTHAFNNFLAVSALYTFYKHSGAAVTAAAAAAPKNMPLPMLFMTILFFSILLTIFNRLNPAPAAPPRSTVPQSHL